MQRELKIKDYTDAAKRNNIQYDYLANATTMSRIISNDWCPQLIDEIFTAKADYLSPLKRPVQYAPFSSLTLIFIFLESIFEFLQVILII